MPSLGPNEPLIGKPGSRALLDTPALCVDLDAMERNIAAMAEFCRDKRIALRPHAKTHKSVKIAEQQIAAGAIGLCCATIGEAEIMVEGGIKGVHVTSPQVTPSKIARVVALNLAAKDGFSVVVDHPQNLADLAVAASASGKVLDVLVDFSAGHHRTGAATEDAIVLAQAVHAAAGLRLAGLQSYSGNLQHVADRDERQEKAKHRLAVLAGLVGKLRAAGLAVPVVTGSGTGTHDFDVEAKIFTELQAGSYIFMDVDYIRALKDGRNALPFETSLFVQTAVVSVASAKVPGGYVTTDAGLKCFATEGPQPEVMSGGPPGATYAYAGDEHGRLFFTPGTHPVPALGERIELVTPHCDPTVNLHDFYHLVRGDTLVDIWPVDARGKR